MKILTPLLTVDHLKQYFKVSGSFTVKAVEDVSFKIYPGETYGLVGESGSGKSTIGRSIIRLYDPTAGEIRFNGLDISGKMSKSDSQTLRTQMQMIFQDPMASLNPRKKVEDIIGEGLDIHHKCKNKEERDEMVKAILAKVGLAPEHATRYPHQFSGGQRQRIGIARALIMNPKLIIADECHLCTGCIHSGTGSQPDEGYPAGNRHSLSVHRSRSVHGKIYLGSYRSSALRTFAGDRNHG